MDGKPSNSIAKVKIPGDNTERPIIPYAVSDGTHLAVVPQMEEDTPLALQIDIVDLTQD